METSGKWITEKFQHPLVVLFFFLGALLIILGVSNGVKLPGLDTVNLDASFRTTALILGCVFCLFSVGMYYRPPKDIKPKNQSITPLPKELTLSFAARREALSDQQAAILRFLIRTGLDGQYISMETIKKKFRQYSTGELVYRLEHLRLLGFLSSLKIRQNADGSERVIYKLSEEYIRELGGQVDFRAVQLSSNQNPDRYTSAKATGRLLERRHL